MIDRRRLKETATMRMMQTKPSPYLVTLIYYLILFVVNYLVTRLNEPVFQWFSRFDEYAYNFHMYVDEVRVFRPVFSSLVTANFIIAEIFIILLGAMTQIITVGYMSYCLGMGRGFKVSFSNLGDGFYRFFKLIGIMILTSIFCFLWSLLFIIPGIVAAYRYRLAYYIALDHPEYGPLRCIRESKELMRGYKGALFVLDLSFLGWYILCTLTLGILYIFKLPYFHTTYALFYDERIGWIGQY